MRVPASQVCVPLLCTPEVLGFMAFGWGGSVGVIACQVLYECLCVVP